MSELFGSDNLVFVPPGARLQVDDVVSWRRFRIDTLHARARVRPGAFEVLAARLRAAGELLAGSRRFLSAEGPFREDPAALRAAVADMTAALDTPRAPEGSRLVLDGGVTGAAGEAPLVWWMRLTDQPAERFAAEDYDESEGLPHGPTESHPLFGSVAIEALDGLEHAMPGSGAEAPFALDVPEGGVADGDIPLLEPLPLVDEYCGTLGVSARGASVNIGTRSEHSPEHLLCTPLHRVGAGLFATLYLHLTAPAVAPVMARIRLKDVDAVRTLLGRSGFEVASSGPMWTIHARRGDVVHVYHDLPGKESEGQLSMPPFVLVAAARGLADPELRSAFLGDILETAGVR